MKIPTKLSHAELDQLMDRSNEIFATNVKTSKMFSVAEQNQIQDLNNTLAYMY